MRLFYISKAVAASLLTTATATVPAAAQRDSLPWITHRDVVAATVAVAATIVVAPFDRSISTAFTGPHWQPSTPLRGVADHVAALGGRGPFVISGVLYAVGSAAHHPALSRVALHSVEAIALGGGVAGLIRGFTGRALPNVSAAEQFSFGRGFHSNNGPFVAFPSGHTTAAFAIATTVSAEVRREAPGVAPVVTPAVFTLATAVGFARVAQRVHWPTDLPLASALGIWSGRAVQAHARSGGLLSSAIRGVAVAPGSNGRTLVMWSSRTRRELAASN